MESCERWMLINNFKVGSKWFSKNSGNLKIILSIIPIWRLSHSDMSLGLCSEHKKSVTSHFSPNLSCNPKSFMCNKCGDSNDTVLISEIINLD